MALKCLFTYCNTVITTGRSLYDIGELILQTHIVVYSIYCLMFHCMNTSFRSQHAAGE